MSEAKVIAVPKDKTMAMVKLAVMLGIISVAPMFPFQEITGPIVNAILFIAVMLLGVQNAIILALLPSTIALSTGLLPIVLAPMIPFIMIGNCILVMTFNYFKEKSFWTGIITASVFKFLFLYACSSLILSGILTETVAGKMAVMMSWPQLFTALAGGILAYGFLKFIKRI